MLPDVSRRSLSYSIWDPTGNITALVESDVEIVNQPRVAQVIMARHPEVEQVGFVRRAKEEELAEGIDVALRMAGGEFCGNASMCAAAWLVSTQLEPIVEIESSGSVNLRVSGLEGLLEVRLAKREDDGYDASVRMPPALGISDVELAVGARSAAAPLVRMQGISHIVIPSGNAWHALRENRSRAEEAVRTWCHALGVDGLGLMFVEGEGSAMEVTPLVYVPGSDTVFWENSCASGSHAVGSWLAQTQGADGKVALREPGGTLCVEPGGWLHGATRLMARHVL